jgi:hypothetical protein
VSSVAAKKFAKLKERDFCVSIVGRYPCTIGMADMGGLPRPAGGRQVA